LIETEFVEAKGNHFFPWLSLSCALTFFSLLS
jgi:hypothetical protein